jgi:transglutaminase-like putative cysteine protease
MPRPPGLEPDVETTEVPYEIDTSSSFDSRWLPTPYPVSLIEADGDWRYDTSTLDFISAADGQDASDMSYDLEALRVEPTAAELVGAGPVSEDVFTPNTALPSELPDSVRELAREVTEQDAGKFDKAVRLQEWFREDGGFEYSLKRSPGNGTDDLEQFLSTGPEGRVGYCEQFAAAMAVMGRTLGIPSRIAVGFLRPERVNGDQYVYSAHDMHAWPEMYFEGTGWVRFEPTPQRRADSVPAYTTEGVPTGQPSQAPSSANPNQGQNPFDQQESLAPAPVNTPGGDASNSTARNTVTGFIGALVVLGLLGVPRLARTLVRRRRWDRATEPVAVAEAAWSELRDSAIDLGLAWDDSVTLRTRARSLVTAFGEPGGNVDEWTRRPVTGAQANPEATEALQRLVEFLERARYSRSVDMQDVTDDVALCVQALRDGTSRQRRFRATWAPESLIRGLSASSIRGRREAEGRLTSEPGIDHAV